MHLHRQPPSIPGMTVFFPSLAAKKHRLDSLFLIQVRDAPFQAFSQCHPECHPRARTLAATQHRYHGRGMLMRNAHQRGSGGDQNTLNSTQIIAGQKPFTQIRLNSFFCLVFRIQGTWHHPGGSAYVPTMCRAWEGSVPPIRGASVRVPTRTSQPKTKLGVGRVLQRGLWGEDDAGDADASSSSASPLTPRAGTPRRASAPGFSQQGMGSPHPTSQRGNSQAHPAPAQGDVGWDSSSPLPPFLCMSTAGYLFIFMSFLQPGPIVKA